MIERFYRPLQQMLAMFINEIQNDASTYLVYFKLLNIVAFDLITVCI